ncbi:MAG: S-layer homology domain-containing protein [Bacillaceae bacterium]|nr:S-layer homology domain-containing protein [Bacillaceae bacterium]
MRLYIRNVIFLIMMISLVAAGSGFGFAEGSEEPPSDQNEEESSVFPDVDPGYWAKEDIEAMYQLGAFRVKEGEPFRPYDPVTRAEFIHMMLVAKGITPIPGMVRQSFADVTQDDWFYPYVETAYSLGITNGKSSGENRYFKPDDPMTRQEVIVMAIRARGDFWTARSMNWQKASQILSPFKDQHQLADWGRKPMALAVQVKMARGYQEEDGSLTLRPDYLTTRAEAASFIYRGIYKPRQELQKIEIDGIPIFYKEVKSMEATAYTTGETGVGYWTATDMYVRKGIVAVDPNVIPYGTHLYVENYGFAVAADRGSAIKNNKIDLYVPTLQEAYQFGRQYDVKVYILD